MKLIEAAVLVQTSQPLELKTITHRKLKKGQVLVKILYSGICRSQLMEVKGLRGEDKWLPHLLGHEGSGIVEQIGEGVKKVKVGSVLGPQISKVEWLLRLMIFCQLNYLI